MRLIAILLLVASLMIGGQSVYYRSKADKLYDSAISQLPERPRRSYRIVREMREIDNLLTLGRVSRLEREYLDKLMESVLEPLRSPLPRSQSFESALSALSVLENIENDQGFDLGEQKLQIITAAMNHTEEMRKNAPLVAWNALTKLVNESIKDGYVTGDQAEEMKAWLLREDTKEHRRTLGLQDARAQAVDYMRQALEMIGMVSASTGELTYVLPIPGDRDDEQLYQANLSINHAIEAIATFQRMFVESNSIPTELEGLYAKLMHNRATVMMSHRLDRGDVLRSQSSMFIVNLTYNPNAPAFPSPSELYGAYYNQVLVDFSIAIERFGAVRNLDPSLRAAYEALALWNKAWMINEDGGNSQQEMARIQALRTEAADGPGAAILHAMNQAATPLMIVQLP